MKKIKLFFYAASIAAFLGSCSGKDGAPGATGPAGTNGTNGTNGVANISTLMDTISASSWTSYSGYYIVNVSDPAITNVNTDGVFSYISSNAGQWLGLPVYHVLANGDNMIPVYQNGTIRLAYEYSSAPTVTLIFKVVVIPPSIIRQHPNVNMNDYNAVCQAFKLKK